MSKSEIIRNALAKHPEKTPKEISELLAGTGVIAKPQYVSLVKYQLKTGKKAKGGKSGKKRKTRRQVADRTISALKNIKEGRTVTSAARTLSVTRKKTGETWTAEVVDNAPLGQAAAFVAACGGFDQASDVLATLKSLQIGGMA